MSSIRVLTTLQPVVMLSCSTQSTWQDGGVLMWRVKKGIGMSASRNRAQRVTRRQWEAALQQSLKSCLDYIAIKLMRPKVTAARRTASEGWRADTMSTGTHPYLTKRIYAIPRTRSTPYACARAPGPVAYIAMAYSSSPWHILQSPHLVGQLRWTKPESCSRDGVAADFLQGTCRLS